MPHFPLLPLGKRRRHLSTGTAAGTGIWEGWDGGKERSEGEFAFERFPCPLEMFPFSCLAQAESSGTQNPGKRECSVDTGREKGARMKGPMDRPRNVFIFPGFNEPAREAG